MSERSAEIARKEYSFARGQERMLHALQVADLFGTPESETLWSRFPIK
jgi:hypothetical protein